MAARKREATTTPQDQDQVTNRGERLRALNVIEKTYENNEAYKSYEDDDDKDKRKALDITFINDLFDSLSKVEQLFKEGAPHLCEHGRKCYRKNPQHIKESHNETFRLEALKFDEDVERFLTNSKNIFDANTMPIDPLVTKFSLPFLSGIQPHGIEKKDLKCQFHQNGEINFKSFYFMLLLNIIERRKHYIKKYGAAFLIQLMQTFDEVACTGYYEMFEGSYYANILKECRPPPTPPEKDDRHIISNTAIQECIRNIDIIDKINKNDESYEVEYSPENIERAKSTQLWTEQQPRASAAYRASAAADSSGGKGTSRRKTKKRTQKSKRSKSKRSKSKRSKSKRSKSKRSKIKKTKKNKRTIQ